MVESMRNLAQIGFQDATPIPFWGPDTRVSQTQSLVGLAASTMVTTQSGDKLLSSLTRGERVVTRDHGCVEIAWVSPQFSANVVDLQRDAAKGEWLSATPENLVLLSAPRLEPFCGRQSALARLGDIAERSELDWSEFGMTGPAQMPKDGRKRYGAPLPKRVRVQALAKERIETCHALALTRYALIHANGVWIDPHAALMAHLDSLNDKIKRDLRKSCPRLRHAASRASFSSDLPRLSRIDIKHL